MRSLPSASVVVLAAVLASATHGTAQEKGPWSVSAEVGASLFFGNTEQATLTSALGAERADSVREFNADGRFSYGEATDADGRDFVTKRSWEVGTSYDHHPYNTVSPFAIAKVEGSYEQRIEERINVGAGAKLTFDRTPSRRLDVSVALLAERTNPADAAPARPTQTLARWSTRFRARRTYVEGRLVLNHETFYRPELSHPSDFTLGSRTGASLRLNEVVSLKVTFVDSYDSEAVTRGARTNNDGQLLFSVSSTF